MKNYILEYINNSSYQPSTFEELIATLNIEKNNLTDFTNALSELLSEYRIFLNKKKDRYLSSRLANLYVGKISVQGDYSYGFIQSEGFVDLYVPKVYLCDAFNGDEVLFSLSKKNNYKSDEAVVKKIIKRKIEYLVGNVVKKNNLLCLEHNQKGFPKNIRLKNTNNIKLGYVVRCKIIKYDRFCSEGEITDVIGNISDLGIDITSIAANYNLRMQFSEDVISEANNLSNNLDSERKRRVDYTNKKIFTIDGKDAKDLDDAVSIEILENGNYLLGVYIADVSYYVVENSKLDEEAYLRGTSVYLADRVIPMLPVRISNDFCSLNPSEEKLVIACLMEVNEKGEVVSSDINEGIIKTIKRLNYDDCNLVLTYGIDAVKDYDVVYDELLQMKELADIIKNYKQQKGCLDFDIKESKLILDEQGKVIDILPLTRGIAEHIIEQFMILANETVASFIEQMDLPFIYRVHDKPDNIKFNSFKIMIQSLGYNIKSLRPLELQKLLANIDDSHEYLKTLALRLMAKAVYSEKNIGHFGLASESYTHFTSPIRRYPDLLVHRLLRKYIFNNDINVNEFLDLTKKISEISDHSSQKERNATECEMKVIDMKKAEYMQKYIGDCFHGIVSSITKFGAFVTIKDCIDGLIHVSNMDGDYFQYDSKNNLYIGKRTGKKIKLGDDVLVQLIRADKESMEIDFKLVYNNISKMNKGEKNNGKRNKKSRRIKKNYC